MSAALVPNLWADEVIVLVSLFRAALLKVFSISLESWVKNLNILMLTKWNPGSFDALKGVRGRGGGLLAIGFL